MSEKGSAFSLCFGPPECKLVLAIDFSYSFYVPLYHLSLFLSIVVYYFYVSKAGNNCLKKQCAASDTSEHPYKGPGDMKCVSSTSEAFGRAGAGELASAGISLGLNWQAARTAHLF